MKSIVREHTQKILIAAAIVALVLGILAGRYFMWKYTGATETSFNDEFSLVLKDYDNTDVRLSEFKNRILIVTMWASWCPYCSDELRNFSEVQPGYSDDLLIVAVNRAEPPVDAKSFSDTLSVSSNVKFLLDPDDALFRQIGGYAMPETLFIDKRGQIVFHQRGPMTKDEVRAKMAELLK